MGSLQSSTGLILETWLCWGPSAAAVGLKSHFMFMVHELVANWSSEAHMALHACWWQGCCHQSWLGHEPSLLCRLGEGSGVQLALRQESDDEDDDEDDDALQHQAASLPIAPLPKQPKTGTDIAPRYVPPRVLHRLGLLQSREAVRIACRSEARLRHQLTCLSCHLLACAQVAMNQVQNSDRGHRQGSLCQQRSWKHKPRA